MNQIGPYEIIDELGQGGMGIIYRALQPSLNRMVALKTLPQNQESNTTAVRRFQQEAQTAANLKHQNIVQVHDAAVSQPPYYYVMELLEGGTLAKRMSEGPLPLQEALSVIEPIGCALDYAHQQKVIHRDVCPSNIMFDGHGNPVLTDFGIARSEMRTIQTMDGSKLGKPDYMSPEQAKGLDVDCRSDLYSLAVVTYEMLTGRVPFKNPDPLVTMRQIIDDPVPPPSSFNSKIPAEVDRILRKALFKKPENRYETAEKFAQALHIAPPPPPPERWWAKMRKRFRDRRVPARRSLLTGVLFCVLVAIAGLVISTMKPPPPPPPNDVRVPNVHDMSLEDAIKALRVAGLIKGTVDPKDLEKEPSATVNTAIPSPGALVKSGSSVSLTLSKREKGSEATGTTSPSGGVDATAKQEVPNLISTSSDDAKSELEHREFVYKEVARSLHPSEANGNVFWQNPVARTQRPSGAVVKVKVSVGPRTTMPPVRSKTEKEAGEILRREGITRYSVQRANPDKKKGQVFKTSPDLGQPVIATEIGGGKVTIYVGKGRAPQFRCSRCGGAFGSRSALKQHKRTVHPPRGCSHYCSEHPGKFTTKKRHCRLDVGGIKKGC